MRLRGPFASKNWALCALIAALALLALPVLAADVSGAWTGQIVFRSSPQQHVIGFNLKADGSKLTGNFCINACGPNGHSLDIQNGKIDGDKVSFSVALGAPELPRMDIEGTLQGDTMNLVVSGNPPECGDAGCEIGEGSATRATPN